MNLKKKIIEIKFLLFNLSGTIIANSLLVMVSINKNIFTNKDNGLSLSNSKKNTDELFAELFSILHSGDNFKNMNVEKDSGISKSKDSLKKDQVRESSEVSNLEIEAAKYLAETFYKEIGIIEEDNNNINEITEFVPKTLKKSDKSPNIEDITNKDSLNKDSLNKITLSRIDNEFSKNNNFELNVKVDKIQNKEIKKEKVEVDNFQIMKKIPEVKNKDIKNEKEDTTNIQSKSIRSNLIEKKQKKKNKQIFQNISSGSSELDRSITDKKITIALNNTLNIETKKQIENFSNRKIIETKDKIKIPKQVVSNSNEHKILNFMENNWEQKFSTIIKESLRSDINKIELDIKPKNLGKVRLEVMVDKDVTKIDLTAENIETANLLNENINKISDFLNEGKDNYFSHNKNSNQNFNHQKNNKDSYNHKNLIDKKEKSSIDKTNNSNHNIDVNA